MAYDFENMTTGELRSALAAPTGDHFARSIAAAAIERLEEANKDADEMDQMLKSILLSGSPEKEGAT